MTHVPSPPAIWGTRPSRATWGRPWWAPFLALFCAALVTLVARAQDVPTEELDADGLRSRHAVLAERLARNDFGRPLVLLSLQAPDHVAGSADAVLDAPFEAVSQTFASPQDWCGILLLHLNTRRCQVKQDPKDSLTPTVLNIHVGKKTTRSASDSPADTFTIDLRMDTPVRRADWMSAHFASAQGPLGTRDYRISVQAIPLGPGQTYVHFRYAYGYGLAARLAMQAYLATFGSSKIGFSWQPAAPGQTARRVGGLRGAIERNTMRYYLAIEVYLHTRDLPVAQRLDQRLQSWFDATEQYRAQLHEIDRDTYVMLKQRDFRTRRD